MAEVPKTADDKPARHKIVAATIACIERLGIDATSVREIAREAGVNVAAVNYYFGSKEKLLAVALEATLEEGVTQALVAFDRHVEAGTAPRLALEEILDELLAGALRYPRLAYAHMRPVVVEQDYGTDAMERQSAFVEGLAKRLRTLLPDAAESRRRIAAAQAYAVILSAGLMPQLFHRLARVDLGKPRARRTFVERLVDSMLA